jgi:hypothetical protein
VNRPYRPVGSSGFSLTGRAWRPDVRVGYRSVPEPGGPPAPLNRRSERAFP